MLTNVILLAILIWFWLKHKKTPKPKAEDESLIRDNFSFIINNIGDTIYTSNAKGFFTFINKSCEKLFGYKPEELIGQHFSKIVHPDDAKMVEEFYKAQFNKLEETTILDFRVYSKSGNIHWVQQNVRIHKSSDANEKIIGFQAVVRDITSRKELEKKYKFIISNAKEGIYISNPKGDFTFVNESMKNILGYESFELIGKNFKEVIHPEDLELVSEFYKINLTKKTPDSYFEFRVIDKFGRCKWVGQNVKAIEQFDDKSKIQEYHSIVRDITTRKVYEMELDRLSLVARKTKNIILFLDHNNKVSWVNETFTKVFGYSSKEVIGINPGDLLNGKKTSQEELDKMILNIQQRKSIKVELINYTKSGKEIWVEITMDPFTNSEGETGYIAVEQEITERKNQQSLINRQHKEIRDSINYSSRIQNSIIPSERDQLSIIPNSFVWFSPKDIVSGDFYMVDRVQFKSMHDFPVFIVADCTGHGVPGAMLSVMCYGILKQAIANESLGSPADILEFSRSRISVLLQNKAGKEIHDGMDLGIGIIDEKKKQIHYSGANRPLWQIRQGVLTEFKGDRQHVGHSMKREPFTNVLIPYEKGDAYYVFSDGISDQFGGEKGKRYMSKKLKNLLIENYSKNPKQQLERIRSEIENWQANNEQTDDICIMGIKL